jgi:hypothetical protein
VDGERFDHFARSLTGAASRRTALLGFVASAVASPLLGPSLQDAAAKKHHHHKKHKHHGGGNGGCPAGQTDCGNGQCVDLASDPNNCGRCGNVCAGEACRNGACTCENEDDCPDGCLCVGVCNSIPICTQDACVGDEDCPVGSACTCVFGFGAACSNPCDPA